MQSPDHPDLVFLEALQTDGDPAYTLGRPDGKPLWIVKHDMEASEHTNCAENTAQYFHTGAGGRSVSAHYCWDNTSGVQCVRLRDSAWTVGNRPGNNRGINHEMCGFASQTRAQWLDPFGIAMMERMAAYDLLDAAKYGIPLRLLTVAELKAWKPGITSHNDLRLAFGGTTHTDPGSNFPWDYYLELLEGGVALTPAQDLSLKRIEHYLYWDVLGDENPLQIPGDDINHPPNRLIDRLSAITEMQAAQQEQLNRIEAMLSAGGGDVFVPHQHITDGGTPAA